MPIRFSDILKYLVVALFLTMVLGLLLAPYAGRIVEQWSRADVEARSRLVFHAIEPMIDRSVEEQTWSGLSTLFARVALDKRILAAGYCDASGVLIAQSPEMPASFSCEKIARGETESFSSIRVEARKILVAAFPMVAKSGRSYFVILTDLSFADARSAQFLAFLLSALAGATLVLLLVGAVFVVMMLRNWTNSLRRTVEEIRQGRSETTRSIVTPAIDRELRQAAAGIGTRFRQQSGRLESEIAARSAQQRFAGRRSARGLQSRAIHPQRFGDRHTVAGERTCIGARARHACLRGYMDCSWQRKCRSGIGGRLRQGTRAGGSAGLYASARLDQ